MVDNRDNRGSPDNKRINVNQPYEMRDWAKKFGVTKTKLKRAVNAVGTSATKVEKWLEKN